MKIVIEIPEDKYRALQIGMKHGVGMGMLEKAVLNGMILPKGHGRLIDADDLRCENTDFDTYNDYCTMFDEIDNAPTIIEADGEAK